MKDIWKYDIDGNERLLEEQLKRRKADLKICEEHISWYGRNPLRKNQAERIVAHNMRLAHQENINKDITIIVNKIADNAKKVT